MSIARLTRLRKVREWHEARAEVAYAKYLREVRRTFKPGALVRLVTGEAYVVERLWWDNDPAGGRDFLLMRACALDRGRERFVRLSASQVDAVIKRGR